MATPNQSSSDEAKTISETLISELPRERGWETDDEDIYLLNGFWYPTWVIHSLLALQQHFKPHPNDVLLASFPKSGTTWLKALVFSIVNRATFNHDDMMHPLLNSSPHELVHWKGKIGDSKNHLSEEMREILDQIRDDKFNEVGLTTFVPLVALILDSVPQFVEYRHGPLCGGEWQSIEARVGKPTLVQHRCLGPAGLTERRLGDVHAALARIQRSPHRLAAPIELFPPAVILVWQSRENCERWTSPLLIGRDSHELEVESKLNLRRRALNESTNDKTNWLGVFMDQLSLHK
nr:flavonol sulfotransferase-like [Ipomoea batatas]